MIIRSDTFILKTFVQFFFTGRCDKSFIASNKILQGIIMSLKIKLKILNFNRILLILKFFGCIFILLFVLSPKPAESARCIPNNECYIPTIFWPYDAYYCPCSGDICDFGIYEHSCDGCWCNPIMNTQVTINPCTIFCDHSPFACYDERIAINLCSTWLYLYKVHITWYEVFGLDYISCDVHTCFNCEEGIMPECGKVLCRCPRS